MQEAAALFLFTALGIWLMVMAVRLIARNVANAWANQQVNEISVPSDPVTFRWPRWATMIVLGMVLVLVALANYSPGAFGWTLFLLLVGAGLLVLLAVHRTAVNAIAPQEKSVWGFSVRVAAGVAAILLGIFAVQGLFFGWPATWISQMQFKKTIQDRADQFGGWEPVVQASHAFATSQSNQLSQVEWWNLGTNGFRTTTVFRNRKMDDAWTEGENNPPLPAELARLRPVRAELRYTPEGTWTFRIVFDMRRHGYSVTTRYSPSASPAPATQTAPAPFRWRRVSDGVFEVY